jgi:branched-chain amino acid transport system substrate-binding protein
MGLVRRARIPALAAAAGCLLVLAACGPNAGQSNSGPIKIGVTGPFSGPEAKTGQDILQSAQVVASEVNKSGGVLGRKLQIVSADDQCQAQVGVQAAQKLVNQNIVANVGGYCSGASIPELGVFHKNGDIPFLTAASSNPQLTQQGLPNIFRLTMRDDWEGPVDAAFMTNLMEKKKVAVLHDNTVYAKGLAEFVADGVKKNGGQVVYLDAITPGQNDYSSALTRIAGLNPDAVEFTGYVPEAAVLTREWKQLGLDKKFLFLAGAAMFDPQYLTAAGSSADGVYVTFPPSTAFVTSEAGKTFSRDYKKAYGSDPGSWSIYEYDAMHMLVEAFKKANSTDAKAVNKALDEVSFDGLTGKVKFDSHGDRVGMVINNYLIKDAKFTLFAEHHGAYQGGQWKKSSS